MLTRVKRRLALNGGFGVFLELVIARYFTAWLIYIFVRNCCCGIDSLLQLLN